jgi:hypothetical protein
MRDVFFFAIYAKPQRSARGIVFGSMLGTERQRPCDRGGAHAAGGDARRRAGRNKMAGAPRGSGRSVRKKAPGYRERTIFFV